MNFQTTAKVIKYANPTDLSSFYWFFHPIPDAENCCFQNPKYISIGNIS